MEKISTCGIIRKRKNIGDSMKRKSTILYILLILGIGVSLYFMYTLSEDMKLDLSSFKLDINLEQDRKKLNDIYFDVLINNAAIGDSG